MRRPLLALLIAALMPLFAPPCAVHAETTMLYGEAPTAMEDRLRAMAVNGQLGAAIVELESFVRQHPEVTSAARLLGDFYFRKPDLPDAERTYKAILARTPNDPESWNRLGGIYAAQDRTSDAIAAFDKSVPEPSVYINLVALHRRRGDLAAFEQRVADNAKQNPTDQRDLLVYGNVLAALHKYDAAINTFKQALSFTTPGDRCPALNNIAIVYLDVHRIGEAALVLEQCLRIEPKNYSALVNTAEANIEMGQYELARPYLDRALKSEIDRPEAYVDIGFLEDTAHNWKAAVAMYQKAILVDPFWRDAYIDLGYDYDEQKLYPLAEAAFLKGLSVSPHDGRLSFMLGRTYREQGKMELARQQYERAANSSDEDNIVRAARSALTELGQQPPTNP